VFTKLLQLCVRLRFSEDYDESVTEPVCDLFQLEPSTGGRGARV
jgi:hypothetical protein